MRVARQIASLLWSKKNCTKTPPVLILKDSEGPMSSEDLSGTVLSPQPPSPGRREGHRDNGSGGGAPGDLREKPGAESVLYLKTEAALPPAPQDISYLPKGKVANILSRSGGEKGTTSLGGTEGGGVGRCADIECVP